jgi:AcrR family transcriptional regulator
VIADEGYLDTTVHKILREARISRRTYYELFKDKEDCFLAAYDEAADHVIKLVRQACAEGGTPERRIENSLAAMLEFAEREPKVAHMCIVEVMAAGNTARERRSQTMELLTELVAGALKERCDDDEEALLRARVLVGGVHELAYNRILRGETENLSDLAGEVVASHLAPLEAVHGG